VLKKIEEKISCNKKQSGNEEEGRSAAPHLLPSLTLTQAETTAGERRGCS